MLAIVNSCCVIGLKCFMIRVEVDVTRGLPVFDVVGLPDASVRESKDRVRTALKNSGFDYPMERITVNLSPANLKKAGAIYDLPIAMGILAASGQVDENLLDNIIFAGELSLSGDILDIPGALVIADFISQLPEQNKQKLITSINNSKEAGIIKNIISLGFPTIINLVESLPFLSDMLCSTLDDSILDTNTAQGQLDFCQVNGQLEAKRGLEIAASGHHNVIMCGSPGSGKTMLASRFPTILPAMDIAEMIQLTKIYSIAGLLSPETPLKKQRPYLSPHHNCTMASLVGGGRNAKPGLLSLACYGILFLDELPEFSRQIIESLRQPLESGEITIARQDLTVTYPANFQLIAALNPCPCGFFGHPSRPCTCSATQQSRYLKKLSGPLLDRIDIQLQVPPVEFDELHQAQNTRIDLKTPTSQDIRTRVTAARARQHNRWEKYGEITTTNGQITSGTLKKEIKLTNDALALLKKAFQRLNLTARSHDKILRLALTIADLEQEDTVSQNHISEAIQYRSLDRMWNN